MNDLEQALRALGSRLELEPTPDVGLAVAARLAAPSSMRRPARRSLVLVLALIAVAAGSAFAASSSLRGQARSWLRSVGIATTVDPSPPPVDSVALGQARLGRRLTLAAAATDVRRDAPPPAFGPPGAAYASGSTVTFVWPPGHGLPATSVRGVGALLSITTAAGAAGDNAPVILAKTLSASARVTFLRLPGADDDQAVWIAGAPHAVSGFDGSVIRFRLAANVLVWQRQGRTYRLEGSFGRPAAVAAARRVLG